MDTVGSMNLYLVYCIQTQMLEKQIQSPEQNHADLGRDRQLPKVQSIAFFTHIHSLPVSLPGSPFDVWQIICESMFLSIWPV